LNKNNTSVADTGYCHQYFRFLHNKNAGMCFYVQLSLTKLEALILNGSATFILL